MRFLERHTIYRIDALKAVPGSAAEAKKIKDELKKAAMTGY